VQAFATLGLLTLAVAAGVQATDPRVSNPGVPGEQKEWHHLAFANELVRVFDVRVPAGSGNLSHQHARATVIVSISSERGDARPAASAGDATISAGGYSEVLTNPGALEQRFIEVEILTAGLPDVRAVAGEPDHVLEIENDRVRIYRVRLDPGDSIPVHTHAAAWLGVTIAGAPGPGTCRWYDAGDANPLTAGQYRLEMVEVEPR